MRRAVAVGLWRRRARRVGGHALMAALGLLVAAAGGEAAGQAAGLLDDDPGLRAAAAIARALWMAGGLVCGGVALARAGLRRHALPRTLLARVAGAGLLAAVVGAVATVPVRAAVATGAWTALADVAVLERQLAGTLGAALALSAAGLATVAVSVRRTETGWQTVGAVGGAVAATAPLLAGHAATMDPRWLGTVAMGGHLLAAAAWIGGLAVLAAVWWAARDDAHLAAERGAVAAGVSTLALGAVAVVAVAGVALAVVQVERVAALTTPYGTALLAKVALVAAVLTVAARNRRRVRRGSATAGTAGLAGGLRLEAGGIAAVLVLSATLASLEPAGQAAAQPVTVEGAAADREVVVVVDPAIAGANELHVYILDDGTPDPTAADAEIVATGPAGQESPAAPFTAGPGHWIDPAWQLPSAGTWRVSVAFTVDGDPAEVDVTVPIRD